MALILGEIPQKKFHCAYPGVAPIGEPRPATYGRERRYTICVPATLARKGVQGKSLARPVRGHTSSWWWVCDGESVVARSWWHVLDGNFIADQRASLRCVGQTQLGRDCRCPSRKKNR